MSDRVEPANPRHDVSLFVEEAPVPQKLECPACDEEFHELVTERVGACTCPECNIWIEFVRSRSDEPPEDDTEQSGLEGYA